MYMENNPLTYVLTSAKLDAIGHHWIAGLANYNFVLNYQSGKTNADALSHISKGGNMTGTYRLIQYMP